MKTLLKVDHKNQKLLKRLISDHISVYKNKFIQAVFWMILSAIATSSLPFLLKSVFDDIFNRGNPYLLIPLCSIVLTVFVMKGISSFFESTIMAFIGQKIITDFQKRLFCHLMNADLQFFHKNNSGELISRFTNDTSLMRNAFSETILGLGRDSITLVLLTALMFIRDWFLAIFAIIVIPLAAIPIAYIGKKMRGIALGMQEELGRLTVHLSQVFQGIRLVKAYGTEKYEIERTNKLIDQVFKYIFKSTKTRSSGHPVIETLSGIAITFIIGYGGYQVMKGHRTPGDFISFIAAMVLLYQPLKRLSNLNASFQEGLSAAGRIYQVLDIPSFIKSPSKSFNPNTHQAKGEIVFDKVSFSYNSSQEVLHEISLTIQPGQKIAIVGHSGAGKSSFINLIPRFYDVTEGTIYLDGQDIKSYDLAYLRQQISLVSQEMTLFDESVSENISYGESGLKDFKRIEQAAKEAAAHDFISRLPQKYDSQLGENGVTLSGGQKQRICIARAIYKNAPILLLDEATSALDTSSEKKIQTILQKVMKHKTTIIVAHRLSTIVDADVIYVLDKGSIHESGNHQKLLKKNGLYTYLWSLQGQRIDDNT